MAQGGPYQLPPLSEVLRDIPQPRDPHHPSFGLNPAPRGVPPFPEAQALAPSLGRREPGYPSHHPHYQNDSSSSDHSDRRSSHASPSSNTSLGSARVSPILPPVQPPPGSSRETRLEYREQRSLPPLYTTGDVIHAARPPPPPPPPPQPHSPSRAANYTARHAEVSSTSYLSQYQSRSPYAPSSSNGGYPMSFDSLSDYADGNKKRRRGNLPKPITDLLRHWFADHVAHPYPTEEEKQSLMAETGLSISQISNWFINARRRSLPQMAKQAQAESDLRDGLPVGLRNE